MEVIISVSPQCYTSFCSFQASIGHPTLTASLVGWVRFQAGTFGPPAVHSWAFWALSNDACIHVQWAWIRPVNLGSICLGLACFTIFSWFEKSLSSYNFRWTNISIFLSTSQSPLYSFPFLSFIYLFNSTPTTQLSIWNCITIPPR